MKFINVKMIQLATYQLSKGTRLALAGYVPVAPLLTSCLSVRGYRKESPFYQSIILWKIPGLTRVILA